MKREDFLKNMLSAHLFRGLTMNEMDELISFAESKLYTKGTYVVKQFEDAEKFFWIEKGLLEVQIEQSNSPDPIPVHILKSTDLFGELTLLGAEKRSASVMAKENSQLFSWKAAECLELFEKNKNIGYQIMKNLSFILGGRVRDMNHLLKNYADALGPDAIKYI